MSAPEDGPSVTLTDFLLARIAEDEAWAGATASPVQALGRTDTTQGRARARFVASWQPARVLAECEAKRKIVELHPIYRGDRIQPVSTDGVDFGCEECHALDRLHNDSLIEALGYCGTLCALASAYADHPDYREEWRP